MENNVIMYNLKAGIRCDQGADVSIFQNQIGTAGYNREEPDAGHIVGGVQPGLHREEQHFREHQVLDRAGRLQQVPFKASVNTFIVDNKIQGGRCEGIFIIESGQVWIKKNQIFENNDGIIVLCAVPIIHDNEIYRNKNMGTFY